MPWLFLLCPRVNSAFYFLALHGRCVISGLHIWLIVLAKYHLNAAWAEFVVLWTRLLQTAQGSLLDDEQLVNTLNSSKTTSQEVAEQLQVSEQTEIKIDAAREVITFPLNENLQSSSYSKFKTSCSLVPWCSIFPVPTTVVLRASSSLARPPRFNVVRAKLVKLTETLWRHSRAGVWALVLRQSWMLIDDTDARCQYMLIVCLFSNHIPPFLVARVTAHAHNALLSFSSF